MKFEEKSKLTNGNLKLEFAGAINEQAKIGNFDFEKIINVFLDLSRVDFINSIGIGIWIRWFHSALEKKPDLKFYFMGTPKILIDQFNNVTSLLPQGTQVKSFAVPYLCPDCDTEMSVNINEGKDYTLNPMTKTYDIKLPKIGCPKCKANMEADINPKKYFRFLNGDSGA